MGNNNRGLIPEKRRVEILKLVKSEEVSSVDKLMEVFGVSRSTIIRDLRMLADSGLVTKTFGGIKVNREIVYSFDSSKHEQIEEKKAIARLAFSLIKDHTTIILNPGVTTLELAKLIAKSNLQISIITNSLKAIDYLVMHGFYNISVLGGDFYSQGYGFKGKIPIESMKFLEARAAFIGVHGIDPKVGITMPFSEEADLISVMMQRSREKIILADHAKFGRISLYRVNQGVEDIDFIVTDNSTDKKYVEKFREKGVKILIANVD